MSLLSVCCLNFAIDLIQVQKILGSCSNFQILSCFRPLEQAMLNLVILCWLTISIYSYVRIVVDKLHSRVSWYVGFLVIFEYLVVILIERLYPSGIKVIFLLSNGTLASLNLWLRISLINRKKIISLFLSWLRTEAALLYNLILQEIQFILNRWYYELVLLMLCKRLFQASIS